MELSQTHSFGNDALRMATMWILVAALLGLVTGCPFLLPLECEGENPLLDAGPDPALACDPDTADCGPGTACLYTECIPGFCFCDPSTGKWGCTADCLSLFECLPDCNANGLPDREEGGGACELSDDCLDTLSECCDNLGGTYLGDGTACPSGNANTGSGEGAKFSSSE